MLIHVVCLGYVDLLDTQVHFISICVFQFKNSEDTCYHADSEMVPSSGRASPVVASVQSHTNFVDHADSELVQAHENSDDLHTVYTAHVLEIARQSIVVDILDYSIPESTFADCLLPNGHMHTDIFYLQCKLLSKDWKDDKVILSWKATVSVSKNLASRLFLMLLLFIFDRWHFYNPARTDSSRC